jgi:hypothetical protein
VPHQKQATSSVFPFRPNAPSKWCKKDVRAWHLLRGPGVVGSSSSHFIPGSSERSYRQKKPRKAALTGRVRCGPSRPSGSPCWRKAADRAAGHPDGVNSNSRARPKRRTMRCSGPGRASMQAVVRARDGEPLPPCSGDIDVPGIFPSRSCVRLPTSYHCVSRPLRAVRRRSPRPPWPLAGAPAHGIAFSVRSFL